MGTKFCNNMFWIVGGAFIKAVLGFVVSIFTARFLGPSNYGIIGYISSITTLFAAFANLGLSNVLIKEYVANKGKNGEVTGTAIALQFFASLFSYMGIVLVVFVFNRNDKTMLSCALIQGMYHIFNCFDSINYYYQSKSKSKVITIVTLIAYTIVQAFKVYLLIADKNVIWYSWSICLEPLCISLLLIGVYLFNKEQRWRFSGSVAKTLLKQCLPFIVSGLISVLYASVDKIMLKEFFDSTEEVGFYNVAYNLSHSWVFLLTALISAFAPAIFEAYNEKTIQLSNLRSRQLYFVIWFSSFIISTAFTIIAPFAIPLLYSKSYSKAIVPAILLVWSVPFAYLGVARNIQITSEGLQKYTISFSVCTVVLNIALNSIFIPMMGAGGAALGTLCSEMFICLIMPVLFKPTRHIGKNVLKAMFWRDVELKSMKNSIIGYFKKNNHKRERKEAGNEFKD